MNIFALDEDSAAAARFHCDKHVVKMILESAQLLSTAHHLLSEGAPPDGIYKASHANHPCAKWARQSVGNYVWLYSLAYALCNQYRIRFYKIHKTEELIRTVLRTPPSRIPQQPATPFPQCMPERYRVPDDAVLAYRLYYIGSKMRFARWRVVSKPFWLDSAFAEFDKRGLSYEESDTYATR
jgi:hypothetical protein